MLIIQNYKKLFFSFIQSNLQPGAETGNEVQSEQQEQLTFNQMFDGIFQDGKIDGNDLANLEQIKSRFESEQTDIFDSTKEHLSGVVEEMLENGYTINNAEDFAALSNILNISTLNEELIASLPQNYEEFVHQVGTDKFSLVLNHQENGFNVYNQEVDTYSLRGIEYETIKNGQLGILMGGTFSQLDSIYRDSSGNNNEINDFRESEDISLEGATSRFRGGQMGRRVPIQESQENSVDEIDQFWQEKEQKAENEAEENQENPETEIQRPTVDTSYLDSFNDSLENEENPEIKDVNLSGSEEIQEPETQEVDNDSQENEELQETQEVDLFQKAESFYSRLGATKVAMEELQGLLMLNGEDFPKYGADGYFGGETYDAIVNFQEKNNLTVDGLAGKQTLRALGITEDTREFYSRTKKLEEEPETRQNNFMDEVKTNNSFMDEVVTDQNFYDSIDTTK